MRCLVGLLSLPLLWLAQGVCAQTVINDTEILAADRPEAWAMNYVAASSLMTAFGAHPEQAPGQWSIALELGLIPHLSQAQRQVGFSGFKEEDLNKSPVFGRLRLSMGLPYGWVGELGYTPPVSIDGARPRDLIALAVGHRVYQQDAWVVTARAFVQHGAVQGDITCPADLAGVADPGQNPFGCQSASRDRISLNYYGIDITAAKSVGGWRWHADLGVARTELAVQVDALVFDLHDRSRLVARDVLPYLAIGASHNIDPHWSLGAEALYVPLSVQRDPARDPSNDPYTSFRLQWCYRNN